MTMKSICTSEDFDNLLNPYTGKPMVVEMVVGLFSTPVFHAVDTYSTSDSFPTRQEAYDAWNRINGVGGLKTSRPIVCAYTGKTLVLKTTPAGISFSGGFNPKLFYPRSDFLYYATMRDGVPTRSKPEAEVRIEAPAKVAKPKSRKENSAIELTDDSIELAEKAVDAHKYLFEPSPTVSMHVSGKKGSKK